MPERDTAVFRFGPFVLDVGNLTKGVFSLRQLLEAGEGARSGHWAQPVLPDYEITIRHANSRTCTVMGPLRETR